jgi:hypothetical protein
VVVAAAVLVPVFGGIALATPGIGIIAAPVHARGTHAELLNVHSKSGVKLQTKSSVDFVTQQIVIAPGGSTGWHSHPGPVLVTVKSGELTLVYADDATCTGRTYRAGESFVDLGDETVHMPPIEAVRTWSSGRRASSPARPERLRVSTRPTPAPAPSDRVRSATQ